MLVSDVIAYCKSFHNAAVRRARLAAASAPTKVVLSSVKKMASCIPCPALNEQSEVRSHLFVNRSLEGMQQ